jgi:hypothetical protein
MTTGDNEGNSNTTAIGAQTAPAEFNIREVLDAVQHMQASVSRFASGNQKIHGNLNRGMDRPSDQLGEVKREIADVREETGRNRDLIRNYRNW